MVIPDSFKHSASSREIGKWIKEGLLMEDQNLKIDVFPIADGGEGTLETLISAFGGEKKQFEIEDINDELVKINYGKKEGFLFIESAEVIGIEKINKLDPWSASSFALGWLIRELILKEKPTKIYLGIGGTATNDGGIGFLQGLGANILDNEFRQVDPGIHGLAKVTNVNFDELISLCNQVEVIVLSDVQNMICGKLGATYLFGPQKGLMKSELAMVDNWMSLYTDKLSQTLGINLAQKLGTGAAGGLGLALNVLPKVIFKSGIDCLLGLYQIEEKIKEYDLVITGEGRIDGQSQLGKVPIGVAEMVKKYQIPLIAIVGSQSKNQNMSYQAGIDLIIDCINEPMSLNEAMKNVESLVKNASQSAYYGFKMIEKYGERVKINNENSRF